MLNLDIVTVLFLVITLSVSIGIHEYAHALMSYKLGDPTPKLQWRLTPNPIAHIDPIGFLMIFLIWFGRGKPVQVNPMYYKKPIEWELMVALAGPASNIIMAAIAIFVILLYGSLMWMRQSVLLMWSGDLVLEFRKLFAFINIALAVFNMLPIPPLDGFRLVKMFFPKLADYMQMYGFYIAIFFLILILWPGRWIIGWFIRWVSSFIFSSLFAVLSVIVY